MFGYFLKRRLCSFWQNNIYALWCN